MNDQKKPEGTPRVGWWIGNYHVVREMGQGGMATIFEAVNEHIGKRVAVKVLQPHFSHNQEIEMRFLNEARSVNLVKHPGLVDIFEFGTTEDGCTYIVMEYLEGDPLNLHLRRAGRLAVIAALRLAQQIASALAAAHAKGVIHRDLKPSNVIVFPDAAAVGGMRVKILDFGIAKMATWLDDAAAEHLRTRTGILMGTPAYMAPEQCRESASVTDRADVYSLGVILYEALAGQVPFAGQPIPLMMKQISEAPCPLRRIDPSVPEELAALVHVMLEKEPHKRPAMSQIEAELTRMGQTMSESFQRKGPRSGLSADPASASPSLAPSIMVVDEHLRRRRIGAWAAALLGCMVAGVAANHVLSHARERGSVEMPGPAAPPARSAAPSFVPPLGPRAAEIGTQSTSVIQAAPPPRERMGDQGPGIKSASGLRKETRPLRPAPRPLPPPQRRASLKKAVEGPPGPDADLSNDGVELLK